MFLEGDPDAGGGGGCARELRGGGGRRRERLGLRNKKNCKKEGSLGPGESRLDSLGIESENGPR